MMMHQNPASTAGWQPAPRLPAVLALACAATLLLAGFAAAAADESLKDGAKRAGHAFGTAARDIGHGTKKVGKEIGHDAKQAGKAVGDAAKEGGREFKRAIKGEH
jgi:hypothetical protein